MTTDVEKETTNAGNLSKHGIKNAGERCSIKALSNAKKADSLGMIITAVAMAIIMVVFVYIFLAYFGIPAYIDIIIVILLSAGLLLIIIPRIIKAACEDKGQ